MTEQHESRGALSCRGFLIAAGGALAGVACGGTSLGEDGGADGGPLGSDGGPGDAGTPDAGVGPSWLLPEGHYEGHFPLHVIYPRPDDETEAYARHRHAYPGVLYEIPIGVQFGKWPYRYELVEGPDGARVVHETLRWNGVDAFEVPEGYGVIAWDVAADAPAGPHSFHVRVYDQDHGRDGDSFVDVTWTTSVGTSQFVFLDPLGGDDATADGSIESPFRELAALQDSGRGGDKICYIRETAPLDRTSRASREATGPILPDSFASVRATSRRRTSRSRASRWCSTTQVRAASRSRLPAPTATSSSPAS